MTEAQKIAEGLALLSAVLDDHHLDFDSHEYMLWFDWTLENPNLVDAVRLAEIRQATA